jgi:hypothetical protein
VSKQLTYYGKKTVPRALRKDIWHPFATVKFPKPEQGLLAIQSLREYRKIRDHCWTWKPTPQEIEKAKQDLRQTGKTELANLNLPTKKERQKLLMDQRAYSVADLADVLERQEQLFFEREEAKAKSDVARQAIDDSKWQKILDLAAEARDGGVEKVEAHILKLEERFESTPSAKRKAKSRSGIMVLKMKRNELTRAREAVDMVEGKAVVPVEKRLRWNQALRAMVQQRTTEQVVPLTPAEEAAAAVALTENTPSEALGYDAQHLAEDITTTTTSTKSAPQTKPSTPSKAAPQKPKERTPTLNKYGQDTNKPQWRTSTHPPKKPWAPKKDRTPHDIRPEIPESSILIQWANMQDAEWAAQWPENTFHEWMGVGIRHSAPQAGKVPRQEPKYNGFGELTEEEVKRMEEGVGLDGESNEEGGEEGEGEAEGKEGEESRDGENKGEKKGVLGRLKGIIPGFGGKSGEARV